MDDDDDRYRALDEFATQKAADARQLVPAYTQLPPPPALFHGTVQVIAPRNEPEIRAKTRAAGAAAGDDWYYSIPYKNKDGTTTYVEGPTIKMADEIQLIYGHCEVDTWVSGEGIDYIEFTSRFIDIERGVAKSRVFRQRKGAAKVGKDPTRNMEIDVAMGASKSSRNVIVHALPGLCALGMESAKNSLIERIENDPERYRRDVSSRIAQLVDIRRVELAIGKPVKDWNPRDIAKAIAMGKTVIDNMATVDETFPALKVESKSTDDQLDELAKKSSGVTDPSPGDKAAADAPPANAAAADEPRKKAIDKLFELASDHRLSPQERLEAIDAAAPQFEDTVDNDFLAGLIKIACRLAKDEIKQTTALKQTETLP